MCTSMQITRTTWSGTCYGGIVGHTPDWSTRIAGKCNEAQLVSDEEGRVTYDWVTPEDAQHYDTSPRVVYTSYANASQGGSIIS